MDPIDPADEWRRAVGEVVLVAVAEVAVKVGAW